MAIIDLNTFLILFACASSPQPVNVVSVPVDDTKLNDRSELASQAVFTSLGQDPFSLVARRLGAGSEIVRSDALYYRSLEVASNGFDLLGTSFDELYRINPSSGEKTFLGKVRGEGTARVQYSGRISEDAPEFFGAMQMDWLFRGNVQSVNSNFEVILFESIEERGNTQLTFPGSFAMINREFKVPDQTRFTMGVSWVFSTTLGSFLSFDIQLLEGDEFPIVDGVVFAAFDESDPDIPGATLPLSGISVSPNGDIVGLSQSDWDVRGQSALYDLTFESNGVRAVFLTESSAPLFAIEFLDDGTLVGCGESLFEIDLATGAATEIGTSGVNAIVDLDFSPEGVLFGVTLPESGESELVSLPHNGGPPTVYSLLQPPGQHWGLAIRSRQQAAESISKIKVKPRRGQNHESK